MSKCPAFYFRTPEQPVDIIAASYADHTRIRRLLNYAFSEQALRSQEDMIASYITLMVSKLHKRAASDSPVDIMRWLNFSTFDITGDLLFDESFGSLESENYNQWIANMLGMIKLGCLMHAMRAYGIRIEKLFQIIPSLNRVMIAHMNYTKEKLTRRLEKKTDRKDFMR
jgi:cytochrome P450